MIIDLWHINMSTPSPVSPLNLHYPHFSIQRAHPPVVCIESGEFINIRPFFPCKENISLALFHLMVSYNSPGWWRGGVDGGAYWCGAARGRRDRPASAQPGSGAKRRIQFYVRDAKLVHSKHSTHHRQSFMVITAKLKQGLEMFFWEMFCWFVRALF